MEVDVRTEIEIDRPRSEVAAYATDPETAPTWYENIEAVEWRTPKPIRVGSRMDFVARFLGRRLAYTYEVRELVPNERLVMSTEAGPFPMETTYAWSDTATGGTRMILQNRGRPAGFSRIIAAPLMRAAIRRATRNDLRRIKEILESGVGGN
jgi:uncharacterized protein YndB with AHSA1/START domain